jgi:hypothetical protein
MTAIKMMVAAMSPNQKGTRTSGFLPLITCCL